MRKRIIAIAVAAICLSYSLNAFAAEWKSDANGWWYEHDDGSYTKNGWETIDGKEYCFNPDGYMYSNAVTPDGSIVAPSGEKIIQGAAYKDIFNNNKELGIDFDTYWDETTGKYPDVVDKGAYYEISKAYLSTIKRFYLDMSGKKLGDIINVNGNDYRIDLMPDDPDAAYTYWGIEAVDKNDWNASAWFLLLRVNGHYELVQENDYSMHEILYEGPVYLSKDCKINTFFCNDLNFNLYQEWLSVSDYLKDIQDTATRRRFYPKTYFHGNMEMDQNGLITSINLLYTP